MEPRPFERGNCSACARRSGWRARFNGATSFRTWKHNKYTIFATFAVLQWSHVLSNVETEVSAASTLLLQGASIEPRPFERGNSEAHIHRLALILGASMEPRPFERGNQRTRPEKTMSGMRFNGATSF